LGNARERILELLGSAVRLIGSEYAPAEGDGNFNVTMRTPPGTSLDATDRAAQQLEDALTRLPAVVAVFSSVSAAGTGFGGRDSRANISVQLVPKGERDRSISEVISEVRQSSRQVPNTTTSTSVSNAFGGGGGGGNVSMNVIGPDVDVVSGLAPQ